MLEAVARELGLRFLATGSAFAGCADCYLPGDGHLSREGHRRLAALVAREIPARADRSDT
jgi:hypothetical protein